MRLGRKAGARACPCPGPGVGGGEKQAPRCLQKLTATRLWMSGYDELSELAKGTVVWNRMGRAEVNKRGDHFQPGSQCLQMALHLPGWSFTGHGMHSIKFMEPDTFPGAEDRTKHRLHLRKLTF